MIARPEIWRQRLWIWLPPALFCCAGMIALCVYRFGYADSIGSLQEELKAQRSEEKARGNDRERIDKLLRDAVVNRKLVAQLYGEDFSTRRRRLTEVTAEVQSLAAKAGLAPRALSYPEQEIESYGLVKRSFIFSVEGTYLDLRKFINLLELSESFLTLEDIGLSQGGQGANKGGTELRMELTLSTLFAKDSQAPGQPAPAAGQRAGRRES